MIAALILANALSSSPYSDIAAAYKRDPVAFCAAVWAEEMTLNPKDADQADAFTLVVSVEPGSPEWRDGAGQLRCPRPRWYPRKDVTITRDPPDVPRWPPPGIMLTPGTATVPFIGPGL